MRKYSSITKGNSRRIWPHNRLFVVLALGVAALVLVVFATRLIGPVASFLFTPVVAIEEWVVTSSSALPSYLRDRNVLLETEAELRQQLAEHAGTAARVTQLEKENEELRTLLVATGTTHIAAGVIGRPSLLPYDVFLLDRGTEDGIEEGAPVYVGDDQVIGFVVRTFKDSSLVTLATTPGYESTVYIYGPNIYTTAVGMGSGSLRVSVPQGILITEGDLVVIPSLSGGLFGSISVVESIPSRPEQYGYVSIDQPLSGVRVVGVGQEPLRKMSFDEARAVVESVNADILAVEVPEHILVDVDGSTGTSTATTSATSTP